MYVPHVKIRGRLPVNSRPLIGTGIKLTKLLNLNGVLSLANAISFSRVANT